MVAGKALTYSIYMRRKRSQRLPPVLLDGIRPIQTRDVIVRIDSYQDIGYISLE